MKSSNIITRKIKYSVNSNEDSETILSYIKSYNNVLRFTFNRLQEQPNLSTKEVSALQKTMNNVLVDVFLCGSAIYDAKAIVEKVGTNKVIFGGKSLMLKRCQKKITNEEWKEQRLLPLCSIGQANNKGNRKFQILSSNQVLFKPNKDVHITLNLPKQSKRATKELETLIQLQELKAIPITYKLDKEYIYIIYDYNVMKDNFKSTKKLQDRVMAVDLNPNYIGWSVLDWKDEDTYRIVDKGVISFKELNDREVKLKVASSDKRRKYLVNKRNYEIKQTARKLAELANHYQCSLFSIENLNIKSSDKGRGKFYNRLCNNLWNKHDFVHIAKKYCQLYEINLIKVDPAYSSFIGNMVYREENLPDMILSSIEIGRRGYEFYHQYIAKDKQIKKNIIFPELERVKNRVIQSLEELNYNVPFGTLCELYYTVKKNSGQRYRVPLDKVESSSKYYRNKQTCLYTFM